MLKNANRSLLLLSCIVTLFILVIGLPAPKLKTANLHKGIPVFPEDIKEINSLTVNSKNSAIVPIPQGYADYQIFIGENLENLELKLRVAKAIKKLVSDSLEEKSVNGSRVFKVRGSKESKSQPYFILKSTGELSYSQGRNKAPRLLAVFGPAYFEDSSLFKSLASEAKNLFKLNEDNQSLLIDFNKFQDLALGAESINIVFYKNIARKNEKRFSKVYPVATEIIYKKEEESVAEETRAFIRRSPTPRPSKTATISATLAKTSTAIVPTRTPTATITATATPTQTYTPTRIPSLTPTLIPTNTSTSTPLPTSTIAISDARILAGERYLAGLDATHQLISSWTFDSGTYRGQDLTGRRDLKFYGSPAFVAGYKTGSSALAPKIYRCGMIEAVRYQQLPILNDGDSFVLTAWVKSNFTGAQGSIFVYTPPALRVWLMLNNGYLYTEFGKHQTPIRLMSSKFIADGSWHQIALEVNSVMSTAKIVIDGQVDESSTSTSACGSVTDGEFNFSGCPTDLFDELSAKSFNIGANNETCNGAYFGSTSDSAIDNPAVYKLAAPTITPTAVPTVSPTLEPVVEPVEVDIETPSDPNPSSPSSGSSSSSSQQKCYVLVVEGIDCSGRLTDKISKIRASRPWYFQPYGCTQNAASQGERLALGIQNILIAAEANGEARPKISVYSHSLGAIAAFNYRQEEVEYNFYDPPYAVDYGPFAPIFSTNMKEITKAADNGIASVCADWTKGLTTPPEDHTPWDYGKGYAGIDTTVKAWIESNCPEL